MGRTDKGRADGLERTTEVNPQIMTYQAANQSTDILQ